MEQKKMWNCRVITINRIVIFMDLTGRSCFTSANYLQLQFVPVSVYIPSVFAWNQRVWPKPRVMRASCGPQETLDVFPQTRASERADSQQKHNKEMEKTQTKWVICTQKKSESGPARPAQRASSKQAAVLKQYSWISSRLSGDNHRSVFTKAERSSSPEKRLWAPRQHKWGRIH